MGVTKARIGVLGLALLLVLVATACGGARAVGEPRPGATAALQKGPPPHQFLAVDRRAHSVTITLIASYNGTNSGFNFDGYSRELLWKVPLGWTVHVVCKNRGPLRHSCAVVRGAGSAQPAFRGAETPQPLLGLEAGHTADFSFRATAKGVYRFVCLVPGHEVARMWDVLEIAARGRPAVVDLQGSA